MTRAKKPVRLSPREAEVLKWIACGEKPAAIAKSLMLADGTVRDHLKSACRKLGALNTKHAIAIALVFGFIQIEESKRGMVLPILFGLSKVPKIKA